DNSKLYFKIGVPFLVCHPIDKVIVLHLGHHSYLVVTQICIVVTPSLTAHHVFDGPSLRSSELPLLIRLLFKVDGSIGAPLWLTSRQVGCHFSLLVMMICLSPTVELTSRCKVNGSSKWSSL
ncbi:hypothetical protein HAX54_050470, partial [Datura stramonium]|nr:hypothetical protein [Datura stramonium]